MPTPLLSFCLATRNRGPILVDCLRHVLACGLPPDQFEILIVDNASTDSTADLVRQAQLPVQWITLAKNCGPVAKNLALKQAQGEFLVLLDDDAYPLPGAITDMLHHFRADPSLAAAVFDVTLPNASREASAYPDVFIGAGTGLRRTFLNRVGLLPAEFFMQAEEYDLSFRLLDAGGKIQRFADMPLLHLKTPAARIGQRTTRLDVRNNLYLLAKYIPAPLCHALAADWLTRYWWMAQTRGPGHRQAYLAGAAEGLAKWSHRRAGGRHLLQPATLETIFKIDLLATRMAALSAQLPTRRIAFADLGKNMYPYWLAARHAGVQALAIIDDHLAAPGREYRGIPLLTTPQALELPIDAIVVSNLSPVHGPHRAQALRPIAHVPVELLTN